MCSYLHSPFLEHYKYNDWNASSNKSCIISYRTYNDTQWYLDFGIFFLLCVKKLFVPRGQISIIFPLRYILTEQFVYADMATVIHEKKSINKSWVALGFAFVHTSKSISYRNESEPAPYSLADATVIVYNFHKAHTTVAFTLNAGFLKTHNKNLLLSICTAHSIQMRAFEHFYWNNSILPFASIPL